MHIVIEGQDATGKDVQAELLAKHYRATYPDRPVVIYSESGTGSTDSFVQAVANLSHQSAQPIDHHTRTLLFLINRYHQWHTLAQPVLEQQGIVITTRSWLSTLIYEGYHGGVPEQLITKLHQLLLPESYFRPDHIVILTLSDQERQRRLTTRDNRHKTEVFKSANSNTQQTINAGYLKVAEKFHIPTLDTAGTIDQVFQNLLHLFS